MDSNLQTNFLILQIDNRRLHADECTAVTLLTNYYAKKGVQLSIMRSLDTETSVIPDIQIGIGDVYDPERRIFDHHQSNFAEKWPNSNVLLSSAGLIWRHYGKEIVEMYLSANSEEYDESENYSKEIIEELTNIIYFELILEIDANENGLDNINSFHSFKKLNISNLIDDINSCDDQTQNFEKATSLLSLIFDIKFKKIINSYFNFPKDLENLRKYNLTNSYIILKEKIPTVFKCLRQLDPGYNVKFVIFPNDEGYTIKTRNNFKFIPLIPIASEILLKSKVCDSKDITYIHKAYLSAKTKTLPTAIEIVIYSSEIYKNNIAKEIHEYSKEELPVVIEKIPSRSYKKYGIIFTGILSVLTYYYFKSE